MLTTKRRTKIIATVGPASRSPENIAALIEAGADIFRLNFSHGTAESHRQVADHIKTIAKQLEKPVCIIADLQGPKIRIASFEHGEVILEAGDKFIFDAAYPHDAGNKQRVGLTYLDLPKDVNAGDVLLVDDGRLVFDVDAVNGEEIHCTVRIAGKLTNHKGINRQGGGLSAAALTEKDRADLTIALGMHVDYIALSFPRSAADILAAKELIAFHGSTAGVIAKIERAEAVDAIDEIVMASDAVMVARGDLGVEIGDAKVPGVQKHIIQRARELNKPVITATQMLETMTYSYIPTRAEVSDVANAVLDGTDAVMLSAETATGDFPETAVRTMSGICVEAEHYPSQHHTMRSAREHFDRVDEAVAMAVMYTAHHLPISAIIALTESGNTALRMSRMTTAIPIFALSRHVDTLRKVTLYRGVYPLAFDPTLIARADINIAAVQLLVDLGLVASGDKVIITKGDFIGAMGYTNAMKVLTVI